MDKRTIIGIILIIIITLLMPFYQKWITGDRQMVQQKANPAIDSGKVHADTLIQEKSEVKKAEEIPVKKDSVKKESTGILALRGAQEEKTIEIENRFVKTQWSTARGGNPVLWELKEYDYYLGGKVNLIRDDFLQINFLNIDGKEIKLGDYNFYAEFENGKKIILDENQPVYELVFYLPVRNGRVVKKVRFYYDKYSYDVAVSFENMQDYIINRRYFVLWENGLPLTEENVKDDLNYYRAFAYMAEELESFDASDKKYVSEEFKGRVDWVAVRTKYFLSSIIPHEPDRTNSAFLGGIKKEENKQIQKQYDISIETRYDPMPVYSDTFTVYLGPLDYYVLKDYRVDLEKLVMNKDWYERLFRPISLLIIPAFKFLYRFIPNYGFVIILFSILIKLLLHPLTKKSYQSMSEMQYLQPKMAELREKYKNDPQRLNKEMMKLYKEHGVNPLGGCLPTLLQMPLLFALFIVFRSTIQLRGQPFILWITDLSRPDVLPLGFNLPIIGDNIHVLPLLMAVTMIWQSKMSITDPKQKMMVYFMPIFMAFIFYSLPSGLNLYYAVFNLLSMAQTHHIKKKMHPKGEEAQERAVQTKTARQNKPSVKKKGRK